jgi:hypothetical protein
VGGGSVAELEREEQKRRGELSAIARKEHSYHGML